MDNIIKLYYLINNKKVKISEISKYILKKICNIIYKNFFINFDIKYILKQSKYSENLIFLKKNNILTGIPYIIKDIFKTKSLKTTCGSRILKNYFSPYNSTIINRLKNIGSINFGKSNMDEYSVGSDSLNYYYGKSENSINKFLTCGGSSGGSTYLVSKKIIPISLAGDTGGSIRQPSYFNNLIGFKPSYGKISRYGVVPYSSSLDHVGFLSKNILNISLFLNVVSGFDIKDSTTFNFIKEDFTRYLNRCWILKKISNGFKTLYGLSLGFSKNYSDYIIDFEIKSNLENILSIFEFLGAKVIFIYILFFDFLLTIYFIISSSELYSNLSKFNNFLYNFNFFKNNNKTFKFLNFSNLLKDKIFIGNYILSSNKNKKYYFYSKKIRRLIFNDFKKIFSICDIVILPILQNSIWGNFKLNKLNNFIDFYTSISNLTGFPSVNIPTGFYFKNNVKIPLGFQIISYYFKEARIIQIVNEFQKLNFF
ncbi:MAG: amidase family protein [Candidatus Nasuia deltocephalinicola]